MTARLNLNDQFHFAKLFRRDAFLIRYRERLR